MPDIKEKLVELLVDFNLDTNNHICDGCGTRPVSESCVEIADHLIANGVTIQEWISVAERSPKNGTICLVCTKHEDMSVRLWDVAELLWIGEARGCDWRMDEVTHWMPLPSPPKGE